MVKKCKYVFLTAAILASAFAAGYSQQETYRLAGQFTEGARWLADTKMTQEMEFDITDSENIPQKKNAKTVYEERLYEDFYDVKGDNYRIKVNFLIAKNTESSRGSSEKTSVDTNLQDKQFIITVENGQKNFATEGGAVNATAQNRLASVNEYLKLLPANNAPVKPGSSWKIKPEDILSPMLKNKNVTLANTSTASCTFKEITASEGTKFARILVSAKASGKLDYTTDEDDNQTGGFKMELKLDGELLINLGTLQPVSLKLNGEYSLAGVESDTAKKEIIGNVHAAGKMSYETKYTVTSADEEDKK